MFLFNSLHPRSFRPDARNVFALFIVSCLFAAILCTGCEEDSDENFVDNHILNEALIGTWESEYFDNYTITATRLIYDDGGYGFGYSATIRFVSNFTSTAGVIIVEYDAGETEAGKFIGVYYENFKPGISLMMGDARNADYSSPATDTLDAAKQEFTMGNKGTYISYMGEYLKQ